MVSEALVAFGRMLTRLVFRVDLKAAVQGARTDGGYDAIYQLLDNTWRAIACAVAWMFLLVISLIPWWGLTTLFRPINQPLTRAIADVGSVAVVFIGAGWLWNMARMALAVTLARQEANRALSGAPAARGGGNGNRLTAPPDGPCTLGPSRHKTDGSRSGAAGRYRCRGADCAREQRPRSGISCLALNRFRVRRSQVANNRVGAESISITDRPNEPNESWTRRSFPG